MSRTNEGTDTDLKVIGEEAKELVSQNVIPHKKYLNLHRMKVRI